MTTADNATEEEAMKTSGYYNPEMQEHDAALNAQKPAAPDPCLHVTLKRVNSGSFHWYVCAECDQKFKATEWDGATVVVHPADTPQK